MQSDVPQLNLIRNPEERSFIEQAKLGAYRANLLQYFEGLIISGLQETDLLIYICETMLPTRLVELTLNGSDYAEKYQRLISVGIMFASSATDPENSDELMQYRVELREYLFNYHKETSDPQYKQELLDRLLTQYIPASLINKVQIFKDEDPAESLEDFLEMLGLLAEET